MCTVDLFPVPEDLYGAASPASRPSPESSHPTSYSDAVDPNGYSQASRHPLTYFPLHPYMSVDVNHHGHAPAPPSPPFQIPRRQLMLGHLHHNERPHDTVHQIGNHLITESSKLTPALVGERFAEPTLVDHQGRKALVFVFGDLAVRREGVFILRYRAFDIFSSVPGTPHAPVLAELYGGPFKVYSTREFPGLEPSTDLTRTLSKYGVRVTLRDAERKSKKRPKGSDQE
ncbi:velvet factor-domain-containing protein [Flammula alnicola]|nr:velvet factor-domain-containing protein [Flammula alnicola]